MAEKKKSQKSCRVNKNPIFAATIDLRGGKTRQSCCGYFYASTLPINGSVPPCGIVNAPTALEVIFSGKGRTVLYFCRNLNYGDMKITENGSKPAETIIRDLIAKDDVKNIRQTLTELFYDFVQSEIDFNQETRMRVLNHYLALSGFLNEAEAYARERRAS